LLHADDAVDRERYVPIRWYCDRLWRSTGHTNQLTCISEDKLIVGGDISDRGLRGVASEEYRVTPCDTAIDRATEIEVGIVPYRHPTTRAIDRVLEYQRLSGGALGASVALIPFVALGADVTLDAL
jgi:hypothetical protein